MTETKIDPKDIDPARVVAAAIAKDLPDLRAALLEMRSYQAVMGSKTAYYHYPLYGAALKAAVERDLVAPRLPLKTARRFFRLSKLGRKVAAILTEDQK